MSKDLIDIDYTLETPIQVSNGGDLDNCFILTLVSPVKKFIRKTYKLQQYFMQAQVQQAELFAGIASKREAIEKDGDEDEHELDQNDVMQMLLSSNVDIDHMLSEFERLVLLGAVVIDDKKLNPIQWGKITDKDKEGLMTKYVAFFISTLALQSFRKS